MHTVCCVFDTFRHCPPHSHSLLRVYERRGQVFVCEFYQLFREHKHARHTHVLIRARDNDHARLPFAGVSHGIYLSEKQLQKEIRFINAVRVAHVDKLHAENYRA